MKLNLDCKDVSLLVSAGQDRRWPAAERGRMQLHLVFCAGCRTANRQIGFLRRAMGQWAPNRHAHAPTDL